MADNYTVRKITEEELDLLIPLTEDAFNKAVSLDYFKWKFSSNPSGKVVGLMAFSEQNEPAAFYGLMPQIFVVDGEEKVFYQACNGMTHSNHTRKGLFKKLHVVGDRFLQDEAKTIGISYTGPITLKSKLFFGWKKTAQFRNFFFPRQLMFAPSKKGLEQVVEMEELNPIEDLLQQSNGSARIHAKKSAEIYRWRISNPEKTYKVIAYKDETGQYHGFVTYLSEKDKILVFDFYFNTKQAGKTLLAYLKRIVKAEKLKGIVSQAQDDSYYAQALLSYGFLVNKTNKGPLKGTKPFTILVPNSDQEVMINSEYWCLNAFEYDAE
ncbi:MAG: GNAT family N-acetyltransferase [Saprospiraceae bacterium]|nr:GNAT family N-acetyltransferase [Saprospiraceae bacterium]